ncbi:MAG: 30S ribosomal protein S6 [Gemmatimonadota bacterium]
MRDYEIVYIFDSMLDEEKIRTKLDGYHQLITGEGGEITAVDFWGKRQLAYPIAKKAAGNYVVVQFRTGAEALPEFERRLKLDDELLRYLIVLSEGEPTAPMSVSTREPSSRDDDEDDDDEEED